MDNGEIEQRIASGGLLFAPVEPFDDPPLSAAISDAERFYASRLQAMSHASYEIQESAPSAAAIRYAWSVAPERNELETFNQRST